MVWPPEPKIPKKIRSSKMQLEMLVDYMKDHKSFANGDFKGPEGGRKNMQQWEDLKDLLTQYGPSKSVEQWRHTWRDLKKRAKDESLIIKRARAATDDISFLPKTSALSSKILSIIQKEYPVYYTSAETDVTSAPRSQPAQRTPGNCLEHITQESENQDEVTINQEDSSYAEEAEFETTSPNTEPDNSSNKKPAGIKIAIVPEGFPTEQFGRNAYAAFVPIMFGKLEDSTELPGVDVEGMVAGAIHISCKKSSDVAWLYNTFDGQLIYCTKVKVLNVKDLPKPVKMSWRTRNYIIEDNSRVLRLMQRAHPTLRTTEWKIIDSRKKDGQIKRTVLMDKISADYIKAARYSLNNGMFTDLFILLKEQAIEPRSSTSISAHGENSSGESTSAIPQPSAMRDTSMPSPTVQMQEVWLMSQENGAAGADFEKDALEVTQVSPNTKDSSTDILSRV